MEPELSDDAGHGDFARALRLGWGASFGLGLITLILGVILAFRPTQSLVAIAVLLGVVMIISGIYHIARALDGREHERVWRGIAGVLFILAGLVLLRHLHLSVALIGLFIGFTWIIQGVSALMETFAGGRGREERGWSVFFGIISLIAGIVVVSAPITTVGVLTVFLGAWFIVLGALEMIGSIVTRRAVKRQAAEESVDGPRIPGQRTGASSGQDVIRQETASQGTADDSRSASRNVQG